MSFPSFRPPVEVEAQMIRDRGHELDEAAARYAREHPEGDAGERPARARRHVPRWMRNVLRRRA